MSETSTMYEWIKALHVIAVIAWMAGMLYLPRLFVYHCEAEAGSKRGEAGAFDEIDFRFPGAVQHERSEWCAADPGSTFLSLTSMGPGSAEQRKERCAASGTR